jgi:hypothetical protein
MDIQKYTCCVMWTTMYKSLLILEKQRPKQKPVSERPLTNVNRTRKKIGFHRSGLDKTLDALEEQISCHNCQ